MTSPATARRLWALGEPFHALLYFAEECQEAGKAAGLTGFWQSYFAMRAAPLGPVGPEVVTATFYNFAPGFVARRVPAIWSATTPEAALQARLDGIDRSVRRLLGDEWPASPEALEAAGLVRRAADAVEVIGRPLAAANRGLPVPSEPHLALWQSLTTLREHRGDGHNAALLEREIDGVMAHVVAAAAGRSSREWLQKARGWHDDAWDAATEALADRRWMDEDGLTAEGTAIIAAVEADTDRLALGPWRALGDAGCDRLAELLAPIRRAVVAGGEWPAGNPIGVPEPA